MELGLPSHELRIEAPLDLGEHQEPEPDLAVVTARADAWLNAHPTAADTLLLIEVADTSLTYDLETKLRLYQQAGIANSWVVDVQEPTALFLLHGKSDQPLLTAMRAPVQGHQGGVGWDAGLPSPSIRRADPVVRWRASSRTVSRRMTRPWRSSRRRCCSFINDAISSTLSFIRITVVSAERMRSVTLTAGPSRQRALRPMPHPEFVRCGWC